MSVAACGEEPASASNDTPVSDVTEPDASADVEDSETTADDVSDADVEPVRDVTTDSADVLPTDGGARDAGDAEVSPEDSAPDTPDVDGSTDDVREPLPMSRIFGPCVEDEQCPGEGAVCRTAASSCNPGGLCTVPCEDRTPCDDGITYHYCDADPGEEQRYCRQRCLNGIDCGRDAYTCRANVAPNGPVCIGICSSDDQCGPGARCEPYSGRCVPQDAAPLDLAVTGEACESNVDCRSDWCELDFGASCLSPCILPRGFNRSTFYDGETLPAGGCAGDSLCLPFVISYVRGDPGICLPECSSDEDCRDDFFCQLTFDTAVGTSTFTNGACFPR